MTALTVWHVSFSFGGGAGRGCETVGGVVNRWQVGFSSF